MPWSFTSTNLSDTKGPLELFIFCGRSYVSKKIDTYTKQKVSDQVAHRIIRQDILPHKSRCTIRTECANTIRIFQGDCTFQDLTSVYYSQKGLISIALDIRNQTLLRLN